jgi:hypothetical protein
MWYQRTKVDSWRSEAQEGSCKGNLESSVHVEMSTKCNTYVQSFCCWGHHVHDTVMRTQMSRPELNTSGCKGEYCNKHETVDTDKLIFFDVKVYTRTWRISAKLFIKKVTQVQCSGCLISNWILSWLESWWHGGKPPKIRDQNFNIQASCGMVTDSTRYGIILQLEEHFSSAIHNQVDMSNFKLWNQQQNKLWMVFLQM